VAGDEENPRRLATLALESGARGGIEMRNSEIRQTILDDHAALRGLFASLRDLLRSAGGGADREQAVRELGAALRERFLTHLDLEDRYLVPALETIDAWGEERAKRVSREHDEQRARLDRLLTHLKDSQRPMPELIEELEVLLRDLLEDMTHEEATVLHEDLLRDDPVTVDVETG
jgi:hemerythrin-like domain-containing protein